MLEKDQFGLTEAVKKNMTEHAKPKFDKYFDNNFSRFK